MKQIDKNTFGKSKAEETLAKILEDKEVPRLTAYVSRLLERLTEHLKNIQIKDSTKGTRLYLYKILKQAIFAQIDTTASLNQNQIETSYLKNAVTIRLKKYLLRK